MRTQVQVLAVLNIAWGILGLIGALVVLVIFGGAMGIIGMAAHQEPGAGIAIPIVGFVGGLIFLVVLVTAIPSLVIGIGLLRCASWSRIAGIVLSAVHLLNVPFGTALGIYGLWVLLSRETLPLFEAPGTPVRI
jgi:hypothetical protein